MRMFLEADIVGGGGVDCGWVGKWIESEEWSSNDTIIILVDHVILCSLTSDE